MMDKERFADCPMLQVPPVPCAHDSCQFSEEAERDYVERLRQLRASDGTPYLRVNGGPGHPFGARP